MSVDENFLAEIAELLGTPRPTAAERTAVLDLTRIVAHSTERRFGPLAVYALALSLDPATEPAERSARLHAAIAAVEARYGEDR